MKKRFMQKDGKRLKFWIRVPKELWDHLPKIISRKVETEIPDIEKRCVACGLRLKALFSRAIKGMVGRATLAELVNEICNDELYSPSPSPKTMTADDPDTRRAFTGFYEADIPKSQYKYQAPGNT